MTDLLLIINITALTTVIIHSFIARKPPEVKAPKPKILKAKKVEMTNEEKRNAQILEDISKYNGMEVNK